MAITLLHPAIMDTTIRHPGIMARSMTHRETMVITSMHPGIMAMTMTLPGIMAASVSADRSGWYRTSIVSSYTGMAYTTSCGVCSHRLYSGMRIICIVMSFILIGSSASADRSRSFRTKGRWGLNRSDVWSLCSPQGKAMKCCWFACAVRGCPYYY